MLTAVNLNVNLNTNLNVERLPELLPISDNFSAVILSVLVQHFLSLTYHICNVIFHRRNIMKELDQLTLESNHLTRYSWICTV